MPKVNINTNTISVWLVFILIIVAFYTIVKIDISDTKANVERKQILALTTDINSSIGSFVSGQKHSTYNQHLFAQMFKHFDNATAVKELASKILP